MLRLLKLSLALISLINSSNIPITTATPPGINQNDKTFVQTACNSTIPYNVLLLIVLLLFNHQIRPHQTLLNSAQRQPQIRQKCLVHRL
ncbi:unnamed protein product [Brassica oleracea var. botrytis]|uniref:Pectinesterase inhibitor domain-containing protein n=1 Tax=Brassica oleracea TaxID=3712 RepID=A0A3P6EWB1_BRAOL|nr:unnamed protein product [Brassica oleracea]